MQLLGKSLQSSYRIRPKFNCTRLQRHSSEKSWRKFTYSRTKCPISRKDLTKCFVDWLEQQDFSNAVPEDSELQEQETANHIQAKNQQLLCGLRALNGILTTLGQPPAKRDFMDTLSKELAGQEMKLMYDTSARRVTNLYHDPCGYYAAGFLHDAIQTQTGLTWKQWDG